MGMLWYPFGMNLYENGLSHILRKSIFTFSKKKYHRRSLYHTPLGVYHRFAMQIYITVDRVYPYARSTRGPVF